MPRADVGTIRGTSFTPARVVERDPKEDRTMSENERFQYLEGKTWALGAHQVLF
jgi:hypothetical protein